MTDITTILADLKTAASQKLANATTMPKDIYTNEDILAREIETLFLTEWLCAGRSDELAHQGDYMSFDLCHQPLILVRNQQGGINALSNICRHRMMRLVSGTGNAKGFTCPYHAWTYDIAGDLVAAPYMDKTDCFHKEELSLPAVRCEEYEGWIYVSLNQDIAPVKEMLSDLSPLIAPYQMSDYQTIFHEEFIWDCNWKSLTENFMESYHLPVAHKQTVGTHYIPDETAFHDKASCAHFTYQTFMKADGAFVGTAHKDNHHLQGALRNQSIMPTVFPAHMYILAPDHLWYLSLQPAGVGRVKAKYGAALAPEVLAAADDKATLIADIKCFLDKVQDEDRVVVESIYQGAKAPLARSGPLSWLEQENHHFTQYLASKLCP